MKLESLFSSPVVLVRGLLQCKLTLSIKPNLKDFTFDQSDIFSSGIRAGFLSYCADPGSYLSNSDCIQVESSSVTKNITYVGFDLNGFTKQNAWCWRTYGSKWSGWEICTFCVTFCQFSLWPGVKMSHQRARKEKNSWPDQYTKESNGIALFLLQFGSIENI